jgi:hypothetical protein
MNLEIFERVKTGAPPTGALALTLPNKRTLEVSLMAIPQMNERTDMNNGVKSDEE